MGQQEFPGLSSVIRHRVIRSSRSFKKIDLTAQPSLLQTTRRRASSSLTAPPNTAFEVGTLSPRKPIGSSFLAIADLSTHVSFIMNSGVSTGQGRIAHCCTAHADTP